MLNGLPWLRLEPPDGGPQTQPKKTTQPRAPAGAEATKKKQGKEATRCRRELEGMMTGKSN